METSKTKIGVGVLGVVAILDLFLEGSQTILALAAIAGTVCTAFGLRDLPFVNRTK